MGSPETGVLEADRVILDLRAASIVVSIFTFEVGRLGLQREFALDAASGRRSHRCPHLGLRDQSENDGRERVRVVRRDEDACVETDLLWDASHPAGHDRQPQAHRF